MMVMKKMSLMMRDGGDDVIKVMMSLMMKDGDDDKGDVLDNAGI